MRPDYNIAIIGAGFGGVGMALQLKRDGEESFVVLEKGSRVGGTWRDNTYPGAACDVQSHLYWFSFEEQPDWSRLYPPQPEILAQIERMVNRRGLAPHIRFRAEVTEARWDDDARVWRLHLETGEEITARVLISAWGQLNRPSFKGLQGVEDFEGEWFHSARWRHDISLAGKRAAAIGNGPSAAQFIPEIAPIVQHLKVFQRSAAYVVPRLDRAFTNEERQQFMAEPERLFANRKQFYDEHETWYGAMRQNHPTADEFKAIARAHLEAQVADPALREKLWPDYAMGCKRIVIMDDFYPAFNRPNVELITDHIERIEPKGVRTLDGILHERDVIIYGTGFETLSFQGPVEVFGRQGKSLRDMWHGGPSAFLGMAIPGFPNLFYLYGPNTNLGHNSILLMMECQFAYIAQALRTMRERQADGLEIRPEIHERFNRELQQILSGSSWAASCASWYKTADGRITNNWSGSVEDYKAATAKFEPADYETLRAA
jgi:cation diffusion facilitator CzcD-associated flavoprotein CzcO